MSEPFLAEIRMIGFNFAPSGWALCDGQILQISQNQSLYSLLGTIYGGDGRTTFALPDLRGRTPIHFNLPDTRLGDKAGQETHTLQQSEMPAHSHTMQASAAAANAAGPTDNLLAAASTAAGTTYSTTSQTQDTSLGVSAIRPAGGGQAHNNMQPFLSVYFCIALQGLFPSRD